MLAFQYLHASVQHDCNSASVRAAKLGFGLADLRSGSPHHYCGHPTIRDPSCDADSRPRITLTAATVGTAIPTVTSPHQICKEIHHG